MIKNTAPKPTGKPQIFADCKVNTVFYRIHLGHVELFDLDDDEAAYMFTYEEWEDRERVDHAVSQFYGFEDYYRRRYPS